MEKLTAKEMAGKWGLSLRRVQDLCRMGKIQEAERFGKNWMIPADVPRPADGRSKNAKSAAAEWIPMPRRSPLLTMTDLYHAPGSAARASKALRSHPAARTLFDGEIAYSRGQIDQACEAARKILRSNADLWAHSGAGLLLAQCAIWRGDMDMWNEAKTHISQIGCKSETDRNVRDLVLAAADCSVYDDTTYPDWIKTGCFELLPSDTLPMANAFYGKLLYMAAYGVATKQYDMAGIQGLSLMWIIPCTMEPLIAQTVAAGTVIPEIYLRLLCATVYQNSGQREKAVYHIDKAIAAALPDRLYGLLAEHWRLLNNLLEERLSAVAPEAVKEIKALYRTFIAAQASLGGKIRNRRIATNLTDREREIAKLVAFGMTNKQIAHVLQIGESTVKTTVQNIMQKTGLTARKDFCYIL